MKLFNVTGKVGKKKSKTLFSPTLVLWVIFCASPGAAIDLAEMQATALKNRQLIQQYVTTLEQSEKEIIRARGGYYPSVDLAYTMNALDEPTITEYEENSIARAFVTWNLFTGFRDKYNLHSAELLKQFEEYQLLGVQQDLLLAVALSYLEVYERRANKIVAEDAFQTLQRVYEDGENRYQVGFIGKNELLKFRVDYDNAEITLQAAEASLRKSINSLSRQVGANITLESLDFAGFKDLPPLVEKDDYTERMLATRSEIKALESVIGATSSQVGAEKSEYYPKVDVVGSYRNYDDNFVNGNGSVNEDEVRGTLVLSLNLFRGFTTEAAVAKTKLEARALGYELDELKNSLLTDLDNLLIDFEVSMDNVDFANRSIEQAEENLRITQLKYDEGLQRESDLLDAITSLSRAQYNYVAVVRTVFSNDFRLTRMIGGF